MLILSIYHLEYPSTPYYDNFEDRPIQPGVSPEGNSAQTFQDLLERALRDESNAFAAVPPRSAPPKQARNNPVTKQESTALKAGMVPSSKSKPTIGSGRHGNSTEEFRSDREDQTDMMSESSFQMTKQQWAALKKAEISELEEFQRIENDATLASPFSSRLAKMTASFATSRDMPHNQLNPPSLKPQFQSARQLEESDSIDDDDDDVTIRDDDDELDEDSLLHDVEPIQASNYNKLLPPVNPIGYQSTFVDFDDEQSWDAPHHISTSHSQQSQLYSSSRSSPPPPRSALVEKLFQTRASLKKPQKSTSTTTPAPKQLEAPAPIVTQQPMTQEGEVGELVKRKLQDLEDEIAKFKFENAELAKLRATKEAEVKAFRTEVQEFSKLKEEELDNIRRFRDEETKKLKRERIVFETHVEALKSRPDKKQREEMEDMKTEITRLREELVDKERKHAIAIARYKDKIQDLTSQTAELERELKVLEQSRLSDWNRETHSTRLKTPNPIPLPKEEKLSQSGTSTRSETKVHVASLPPVVSTSDSRTEPRAERSHTTPVTQSISHPLSNQQDAQQLDLSTSVVVSQSDGKFEELTVDGIKRISFKNGTQKEIHPNGYVVVRFFNGDVKETLPNQQMSYFYAEAQTTHTTYPDGLEVIEFANSQLEKRHVDGTQEIVFPDGTVKLIYPNGEEETIFPDGIVQRVTTAGERVIEYPNGQREIHTSSYKKRRYPDGTVKIVYPDGRQETQYPNGRIRVKDCDGFVLLDNGTGELGD